MNIYYVYAYLRKTDLSPYYIGKGKGNRAYSKDHTVGVPTDRSRIVFLETNLTNVGACAIERRYIRWYGRKDIGTGILRNRTDGGDGTTGIILSESHRQQLSKAAIGNKNAAGVSSPKKGIPLTDSQKKKLSESQKMRWMHIKSAIELSKTIADNS